MADAFRRAVEFERRVHRYATATESFRWGMAFLNDAFPVSWAHNVLYVTEPGADMTAHELAAEADRILGGAGRGHRMVVVDDEALGRRLADGFKELGWNVQRSLVMELRRSPPPSADLPAREVDFEELRAVREKMWREREDVDADAARQLVDRVLLFTRFAQVRCFAAFVDGEVASYCDLYSDGELAQIEDVLTLEPFRKRGLARAVVLRAVETARAEDHDLIFLFANDDDWPKELYAKLGFDRAGLLYEFVKPA